MDKIFSQMNPNELKTYILDIQSMVQNELALGIDIDDFLDKTTIFDDFEDGSSDGARLNIA